MHSATKEKVRVSILVAIFAAVIVTVIALIFFFMYLGIFGLLGIQYDSWKSIVFFMLLAILFDIIMGAILLLPKALGYFVFTDISRRQIAVFMALVQISLDFISVHTIDELERSVEIPTGSELLLVLIVFAVDKLIPIGKKNTDEPADDDNLS
jgi:hypothetical protein